MSRRMLVAGSRSAMLMAAAVLLMGATRHVAPSGSDSGDCSNAASPCRTLQYATNRASCGDVVVAADGTYTAGFNVPISCTSTAPLVIRAANPGGAVISPSGGATGVIYAENRSHLTIDGFSLVRTTASPVGVRVNGGSNITIRNITDSHPCGSREPMYVQNASNVVIDGCNVGQNVVNDECTYREGACYPADNVVNLTIQNSICHDVRNFGAQKNIRVGLYDRLEIRNMHNHGISFADASDVTVQRSTLWHTPGNPVTDIGNLVDVYCSQRVNIRNNIARGSVSKISQFFYSFVNVVTECGDRVGNDFTVNDAVRVHNNIIYGVKSDCLQPGENMAAGAFDSDYNIFFDCSEELVNQYSTLPAWQAATETWARVKDPNSRVVRPVFVNETTGDFRAPTQSAPQVDAGNNANCAHTIVNGRCDIGAHEFGGSGGSSLGAVQNLSRTDTRPR